MARYSSAESIGNYGVASNFIVLISFVTFPVTNILFPAFSKMTSAEARMGLETAFKASIKYVPSCASSYYWSYGFVSATCNSYLVHNMARRRYF